MKLAFCKRLSILLILFAFAVGYLFTNWESPTPAKAQSQDPLLFPVLLVHGLGEGPGDEAFGKLQKYLEDYYFDVEVVDFNDFSGNALADDKDAGNLGTLAALLGTKIKLVLKEYNVTKVNIVAHSYGGLIVQAYLLNYGEEYSKKKGAFEDDVHKVLYVQTPFYGSELDSETMEELAANTDYGPYTDTKKIVETLQLGSQEIFTMHNMLQINNIYDNNIDVLTLVSSSDEVVSVEKATLSTFTEQKDIGFDRFRIFENYSHSAYSADPASNNGSLAYVEEITDPNFITIASFLDSGFMWRHIGSSELQELSILMLQYEKQPGFKKINGDETKLFLEKKYKSGSKNKTKLAVGDSVPGIYNESSRVFIFAGLTPGEYKLTIDNAVKGETIEQKVEYWADFPPVVDGFSYDPKQNILKKGNSAFRADCLYYIEEITLQGVATKQDSLSGLNTDGFEIEFEVSNAILDTFNKGVLVSLHNGSGDLSGTGGTNGSRLNIAARGSKVAQGAVGIHARKVYLDIVVDKNRNGHLDGPHEIEEHKDGNFDWAATNKVKVTVKTEANGSCYARVYVNDQFIFFVEKNKPYWNPNPIISIGGYRTHEEYTPPPGAIIRKLCVRNIEK